jgi:hypothetical protein
MQDYDPVLKLLLRGPGRCVFYNQAPLYGFYAGNDARIDATIPDATAAMKKPERLTNQPQTRASQR